MTTPAPTKLEFLETRIEFLEADQKKTLGLIGELTTTVAALLRRIEELEGSVSNLKAVNSIWNAPIR